MTTVFIGTNEQLINCLALAANTRNCPSVHAGAMIAAAERLAKAEAERDAAVAKLAEVELRFEAYQDEVKHGE